jgi:hypothetical protein
MSATHTDRRFLLYQIRAIRRFQRLREPNTREEAQRLALEWIHRFADGARQRWADHIVGNAPLERVSWKV